jgi:hypothetical protein
MSIGQTSKVQSIASNFSDIIIQDFHCVQSKWSFKWYISSMFETFVVISSSQAMVSY